MPSLAEMLGVSDAPDWHKQDFDGVWTVTYKHKNPQLSKDTAGINPLDDCKF